MIRAGKVFFLCASLCVLSGCTGEIGARPDGVRREIPTLKGYSWDGSWAPHDDQFPLTGLLDNEYSGNHLGETRQTPALPPGSWDFNDPDNDLANWRGFSTTIGTFEPLRDSRARQFGWYLRGNTPYEVDFSGTAVAFEGSTGADVIDLGPEGVMHSFGQGNLGDGPDILAFNQSWSLDFRTGSSSTAGDGSRDNDLVIAGCEDSEGGFVKIETTTIHTGPGKDLVIARDIQRSAIDLGNGSNGRTDATDATDGDDLVLLRGNTYDARVFGGNGNDVAVWYVDENIQTQPWLGLNFFGGGGAGKALWYDNGTDRLVMAIPTDTPLVTNAPTPAGSLRVLGSRGDFIPDEPTDLDPYARYCIECGVGPGGRKTIIIEYNSLDRSVRTGFVYLTAFEELQIGVGPGARVYRLDDIAGTATLADDLAPFEPPSPPEGNYCR